jgi:cytochrome c oxidase subunit 2
MRRERRLFIAGGAALVACAATGAAVWAQKSPRVIPVVARKFVFLPGRIELRKGEPVTLEFTSPDVVMGFNAPDFKIRTDIIPGQTARLTFTPDKTGTFVFLCDVFCGEGHEGMNGELVVT